MIMPMMTPAKIFAAQVTSSKVSSCWCQTMEGCHSLFMMSNNLNDMTKRNAIFVIQTTEVVDVKQWKGGVTAFLWCLVLWIIWTKAIIFLKFKGLKLFMSNNERVLYLYLFLRGLTKGHDPKMWIFNMMALEYRRSLWRCAPMQMHICIYVPQGSIQPNMNGR